MERSVTASLTRGALCLFAGLFMTGFAFTHPNPTGTGPDACPPEHPAFALSVGDTFSVGDRQIVYRAERVEAPAAGETGQYVAADLLIRMRDERTHAGRVGSYVPHLQVTYQATWLEESIQSGEARFRLTGDGPGYGFDLRVPDDALAGDQIQIRFSISNDGATPHNGGSCRLPTALDTILVLGDLPQAPTESLTDSEVDEDPLRMNMLSNLDPRAPDGYNDIWGWNNGTTFLAILGTVNGSSFIDVTDPLNPVEVGYIAGVNSSWRDMKAFGNYVYIGSEGGNSGIQVVDVSDPFNPTLVNTYTATVDTSHNVVMDEGLGHLYVVGSQSGTRILDVATDPVNITEIGDWQPRYVHDAYVANGRAYFSEINNGLQDVLDATDPANLSSIKTWTTPLDFTHNCWVNDDATLIVTTDEQTSSPVAVYDISDLSAPGDPPLLSEFQPNAATIPHNAMFDDEDNHRVAISHYGIGLQYFDAFNPEIPVTLGAYDTYPNGDTGFNGAWGVYPFDPRGHIYISDRSTGLYVFDYAPTGGTLTGVVSNASGGDPIQGARVVLLADGQQSLTNANGGFGVYAPAGEVEVRASAPGFASRIVKGPDMVLNGRSQVDVALVPLPTGPLSGVVRSSVDQSPIENATVEVPLLELSVQTASDGSFSLPEVAIGGYVITASAYGFSSAETRVRFNTAGISGVTLDLSPAPFADDAETDQGWQLGVGDDTAGSSGVWDRVDPNGTGGGNIQPEDDATASPGVTAFITGQATPGQNTEATDVDGGDTTLLSPTIDASGLGAMRARYNRWVATAGGFLSGGGSLRFEASNDGGSNWTQIENVSANLNSWNQVGYDIGSRLALTNDMQFRFRAISNGSFDQFRVLEAGVDDFELLLACRSRFNPGAPDADSDGEIDVCDTCPQDPADDIDADGVCANVDNAPDAANATQEDLDGDGIGDVVDNCMSVANASQRDLDGDGLGNACDDDADGDGLLNGSDDDSDNDGVLDVNDNCVNVPNAAQLDDDADTQGNPCDDDDNLVQGLILTGDRLDWQPESGADSYNVYRGDLGSPSLLALAACQVSQLEPTFAIDLDIATVGDGFFYLVAAVSGSVEQPLGNDSNGTPRSVNQVCP